MREGAGAKDGAKLEGCAEVGKNVLGSTCIKTLEATSPRRSDTTGEHAWQREAVGQRVECPEDQRDLEIETNAKAEFKELPDQKN